MSYEDTIKAVTQRADAAAGLGDMHRIAAAGVEIAGHIAITLDQIVGVLWELARKAGLP